MTLRQQVLKFMEAMDQPVGRKGPEVIPDDRMRLRLRLIGEEFFELLSACGMRDDDAEACVMETLSRVKPNVDVVQVADALGDLDYMVEGMRIEMGINGVPIAEEIHRSNMAKLGPNGKPIKRNDGKVLKPSTWTPPDITKVLAKQMKGRASKP